MARSPVPHFENYWRTEFPSAWSLVIHAKFLKALRCSNYRLGIVTTGRTVTQTAKIKFLGLGDLVDSVTISESVEFEKPDPKIFEIVLAALGTSAAETAFVGGGVRRPTISS